MTNKKNKNSYTKENLDEALTVISSLLDKCEKAQLKVAHKTSQSTLLTNRIKALNIAATLIYKELQNKT